MFASWSNTFLKYCSKYCKIGNVCLTVFWTLDAIGFNIQTSYLYNEETGNQMNSQITSSMEANQTNQQVNHINKLKLRRAFFRQVNFQ